MMFSRRSDSTVADLPNSPSIAKLINHTLLTREDEIRLAQRRDRAIEAGDTREARKAIDIMVMHNMRLVYRITHHFRSPFYFGQFLVSNDDLFQEGVRGLIEAAEDFDWRKGYRFSAYARLPILSYVLNYVSRKGRMINVSEKIQIIIRDTEKHCQLNNLRISPETILQANPDVTVETAIETYCAYVSMSVLSLDENLYQDDDRIATLENIPDETDAITPIDDRLTVVRLLKILDERKRTVVILSFFGDKTNEEIAVIIGCCSENITYVKKQALNRLRSFYLSSFSRN